MWVSELSCWSHSESGPNTTMISPPLFRRFPPILIIRLFIYFLSFIFAEKHFKVSEDKECYWELLPAELHARVSLLLFTCRNPGRITWSLFCISAFAGHDIRVRKNSAFRQRSGDGQVIVYAESASSHLQ